MAVVIETTLGDITVDLYLEQRPVTCLNFLKLCKMKYYNFNLFHSIRSGFIAQTGDPTGEGSGGESIWGLIEGPQKRFFSGEKMPKIRHTDAGLLAMVCTDDMMIGSQFYFTLAPDLDSLDGVHCVIGEVTEGREILSKLNEVICDESHRPYQDVRITHTVVLEDPFRDPPGLTPPSRSPSPSAERLRGGRIAPDEEIDETQGRTVEEIQEMVEEKEAKARATILEIVGDLPDADIAPPENVLFVCKLNPVTSDDDLEIIFSRFGKIVSCEVIRDKKTGDSLQYAFIEFADKQSCEDAYFKMDNVLIDDRRIHVDFSQSVSKMRWLGKGRGVKYFNDNEPKTVKRGQEKSKSRSRERHLHSSNDKEKYRSRSKYDKSQSSNRDKKYSHEKDHSRHRNDRERSRSKSRTKNHKTSSSKRERSPYSSRKSSDKSRKEKHHSNHYNDRKDHSYNNEREKHTKGNEIESSYNKHNEESQRHIKNNNRRASPSPTKYGHIEERHSKDRKKRKSQSPIKNIEKKDKSLKSNKRKKSPSPAKHANEKEIHSNNNKKEINQSPTRYIENSKTNRKESHSPPKYVNDSNRHFKSNYVETSPSPIIKHKNQDEISSKSSRNEKKYYQQPHNIEHDSKHKHTLEDSEISGGNKKTRREQPHTPSPLCEKENEKQEQNKIKSKQTNKSSDRKNRKLHKKRKPSTSSDSSSETSTSSSSTSSSSESDRKKKKLRRKRKESTTSSSSSYSSDSSSSTSSSSTSYSSSTSSNSDRKKKKQKKKVKKVVKKPRKKL